MMTKFNIGAIRDGEVSIGPLKKAYPGLKSPPKRTLGWGQSKTKAKTAAKKTKHSIQEDGIDDAKATSLSAAYKKMLKMASDGGGSSGTQPTLPFNLKLGITIDGCAGIGFLEPITIDRIPSAYKRAGCRFLVTGLEHTFDADGGWDTKIDTAMKIGT